VRRIVEQVCAGHYAVTNIELREGWAELVARRVTRFVAPRSRAKVASRLESLYVYETELREAMRYRLPGKGEARGVFVWDEGHNDLNNRKWRDDGREAILEWATQLRKLGFVGYLLSQHADNTDAALRRVCNFNIRLQNQREQTRAFGLRVTPWPLFLAAWYPSHLAFTGTKVQPAKVERYFLSWHRHLYDTWGLYHGLAGAGDDSDVVMLPSPGRRTVAPAGAGAPIPEGVVRPSLDAPSMPISSPVTREDGLAPVPSAYHDAIPPRLGYSAQE
jgi:hypothetical protein